MGAPAGLEASGLRATEEDGAAAGAAGASRTALGFTGVADVTPARISLTVTGVKRLPCLTLRRSSPRGW